VAIFNFLILLSPNSYDTYCVAYQANVSTDLQWYRPDMTPVPSTIRAYPYVLGSYPIFTVGQSVSSDVFCEMDHRLA
jgi:hypothetical protein